MGTDRITGSFRDPSGYVFLRNDRVFRAIDSECHDALKLTAESGLLEKWVKNGKVVSTEFLSGGIVGELAQEHPGFTHFVEHEKLTTITFPYEWTLSMLADAAKLTLDLQIGLLEKGLSLKDATAYNIQFRDGRPVFIDLSSIQRPRRLDVWFALGQFQRHFLFPLMLARYRGWDLHSYFLPNLDGIGPQQMAENFPGLSRWRPGLLLDVTLPLMLEGKAQAKETKGWEERAKESTGDPKAQIVNLQRLRRKVDALTSGYRTRGAWHDYTTTCTYDNEAEAAKKHLIKAFLGEKKPITVLDLGCNTGDYSYLAAECGATVLSADADHDAAELLYRRLQDKQAKITPMVVNAANPSPAIGYMNLERPSFLERCHGDCVFGLALIHHLLVSANLPLAGIRDLFAALSKRYVVLEFVPVDDVQFQRLLKFRENLFAGFDLAACISAFSEKFQLLSQEPIAGTQRVLLFFEKK